MSTTRGHTSTPRGQKHRSPGDVVRQRAECNYGDCFFDAADDNVDACLNSTELYWYLYQVATAMPWAAAQRTEACCTGGAEACMDRVAAAGVVKCMYGDAEAAFLY